MYLSMAGELKFSSSIFISLQPTLFKSVIMKCYKLLDSLVRKIKTPNVSVDTFITHSGGIMQKYGSHGQIGNVY